MKARFLYLIAIYSCATQLFAQERPQFFIHDWEQDLLNGHVKKVVWHSSEFDYSEIYAEYNEEGKCIRCNKMFYDYNAKNIIEGKSKDFINAYNNILILENKNISNWGICKGGSDYKFNFNNNGLLESTVKKDGYGEISTEKYTYNPTGFISKIFNKKGNPYQQFIWDEGNLKQYTYYDIDGEIEYRYYVEKIGNIINIIRKDGNYGDEQEKYVREYDRNERIQKMTNYTYDRRIGNMNPDKTRKVREAFYQYNSVTKITAKKISNEKIIYIITYEYDNYNNIQNIQAYDSNGFLCAKVEYKFDKSYLLQFTTEEYGNNKQSKYVQERSKHLFFYDQKGNINQYLVYDDMYYPREYCSYEYTYDYGENGEILSVSSKRIEYRHSALNENQYNKKIESSTRFCFFTYDSNNNWIQLRHEIKNEKGDLMYSPFILQRNITYSNNTNTGNNKEPYDKNVEDDNQSTDIRKIHGLSDPEFPGGIDAFKQYITNGLKGYDSKGIRKKIRVIFFVEKDGSIEQVIVSNEEDMQLVKKIVSLLKDSPKWKPGTIKGEPAKVRYILPLTF